jgi:hypothetical protein
VHVTVLLVLGLTLGSSFGLANEPFSFHAQEPMAREVSLRVSGNRNPVIEGAGTNGWKGSRRNETREANTQQISIFSAEIGPPDNMFSGVFSAGEEGALSFIEADEALLWEGSNNYVGFWHSAELDLSAMERIEVKLHGQVAAGACLDLRLEDIIDGRETGRVYRSDCLDVTDRQETHVLTAADFRKFEHFGHQDGTLDWSRIKNISLQVGPAPDQPEVYYGVFRDGALGEIFLLPGDSQFAWVGQRCYFGVSFQEPINLRDLKEVRVTLKGRGSVDLHLIDVRNVSYYSQGLDLRPDGHTHRISKQDFALFSYNEIGVLDWANIKNLQFQVSSQDVARVSIARIELDLGPERTYTIQSDVNPNSHVALQEIGVTLRD